MQILLNLWLVYTDKTALKAILLKTTTLAISDYNFLSILPLKERLNYNKGILIPDTKLCPLIQWLALHIATDDIVAPCIHLHSCLSHIMFDV